MNHFTSFNMQHLLILLVLSFTSTIAGSQAAERSSSKEITEYDCKKQVNDYDVKKDVSTFYSRLFYESLDKIYESTLFQSPGSHYISCVTGYNQNAIVGMQTALENQKTIMPNSNRQSPLMAAMLQYIRWNHPPQDDSFANIITTLTQQEKSQQEKFEVLRHVIRKSSFQGVQGMLTVMKDKVAQAPTILLEAIDICKQWESRDVNLLFRREQDRDITSPTTPLTDHARIIDALLEQFDARWIMHLQLFSPQCRLDKCPSKSLSKILASKQHRKQHIAVAALVPAPQLPEPSAPPAPPTEI